MEKTKEEIREAIFGEIEKLKEQQIRLHKIFKGETNENTTETKPDNKIN